jgi:hypothetical protein
MDLALPKFDELNKLSLFYWVSIDKKHKGIINYEDFCNFVENNEEIQESFINHLGFQMRAHAIKKYNKNMEVFINCFKQSLTEDSEKTEITFALLQNEKLQDCKIFAIVGKLIYKLHRSPLNKAINKDDFAFIEQLIKKFIPRMHIYFYFHLAYSHNPAKQCLLFLLRTVLVISKSTSMSLGLSSG